MPDLICKCGERYPELPRGIHPDKSWKKLYSERVPGFSFETVYEKKCRCRRKINFVVASRVRGKDKK